MEQKPSGEEQINFVEGGEEKKVLGHRKTSSHRFDLGTPIQSTTSISPPISLCMPGGLISPSG